MTRDPIVILLAILFRLNLLEERKTYNVNEFKYLTKLGYHWNTIMKYLKIIMLIQKYSPELAMMDSKFTIKNSSFYHELNLKEKLCLYLQHNNALTPESAIPIPNKFECQEVRDSIGYSFETRDGKFFLTALGVDVFHSVTASLSELIYDEKELDEIFDRRDEDRH